MAIERRHGVALGKLNGREGMEAARRKLKEETGLEANFKMLGTLRSIRRAEGRAGGRYDLLRLPG